jgi:hypothetical protein
MIYFVKQEDYVKIGYASNPAKRISSLQVNIPVKLVVLLIIDGGIKDEQLLHKKFLNNAKRGEWFYISPEIEKFIQENLDHDRRYEFGFETDDFKGNEQLRRLKEETGMTFVDIGKLIGITSVSVKETLDREADGSITIKKMKRFAEALGFKMEYRFVKQEKDLKNK